MPSRRAASCARTSLAIVSLAAVIVGGLAVVVSQVPKLSRTRIGATRTPVPGVRQAVLGAGKYVVYYELDGGNKNFSAPKLDIRISPTGESPVALHSYGGILFAGGTGLQGRAIYTVNLRRSGVYVISVNGGPPPQGFGAADIVLGVPTGLKLLVLIAGGVVALLAFIGLTILASSRLDSPMTVGQWS